MPRAIYAPSRTDDLLLRPAARGDDNRSLYFTNQDHTGPVFAFWKEEVRQFLIDNATFFIDEYHVDGFRYDQATVIVQQNAAMAGRSARTSPAPCEHSTHRRSTSPSSGGRNRLSSAPRSRAAPISTRTGTTVCARDPRCCRAGSRRTRRAARLAAVVNQLRAPGFRDAGARSSASRATTRCIGIARRGSRPSPAAATAAAGTRAAGRALRSAFS